LGYAAAANLGFILALKDLATKYVWLLNDDVKVERSCLRHMISRSESVSNAGICGCRCVYYHNPDRIQALGGGKISRWTGRSALIGNMSPSNLVVNQDDIQGEFDFIFGASMLVSRLFLEGVGLMSEDYFLYYEEPDWLMRGRDKWAFLYSHEAIVFHKGGATIGTGTSLATTSPAAEFYMLRSRLIFTRKFCPAALLSVWAFNVLRAIRALALGYPSLSRALAAALLGLTYNGCILPKRHKYYVRRGLAD
jgi:GT2 family glycosyltransferase